MSEFNATVVVEQVNVPVVLAVVVGTVVFWITETVNVVEQADAVFVTTTVYCPPALTVADAVFAPAVTPGPVQLYDTGLAVVVAIT